MIFDRQYSPFIFHYATQTIIPAESVYAVFEAKQTLNLEIIRYAREKAKSVRELHRTSLPIPHAGGTYPAKKPHKIIGGVLSLDSDWNPPLGDCLQKALKNETDKDLLNLGCVASHGYFCFDEQTKIFDLSQNEKAVTIFLFKLISELQFCGTVPMVDTQAYSKWLNQCTLK